MTEEEVRNRIENGLSEAKAVVKDLKGDGRYFRVEVISPEFQNKPLVAQHRLVQDLFTDEIARDEMHALSIKTTAA
jgi:stress-induced morphogen